MDLSLEIMYKYEHTRISVAGDLNALALLHLFQLMDLSQVNFYSYPSWRSERCTSVSSVPTNGSQPGKYLLLSLLAEDLNPVALQQLSNQ
jgi:hypothetical protein